MTGLIAYVQIQLFTLVAFCLHWHKVQVIDEKLQNNYLEDLVGNFFSQVVKINIEQLCLW